MNIRAVHRSMAARTPAGALLKPRRMRSVPDENLSRLALHLRMTLQTQIRVTLHEQLAID
jgi:hypothetical protein